MNPFTRFIRTLGGEIRGLWDAIAAHIRRFPNPQLNVIAWGREVWSWFWFFPRLFWSFIGRQAARGLEVIADGFEWLFDATMRSINDVRDRLGKIASSVGRVARDVALAVWRTVIEGIQRSLGWVRERATEAWNKAAGAVRWIRDEALPFVGRAIRSSADWIYRSIVLPAVRVLRAAVGEVREWAEGAFRWIVDRLGTLWSWFQKVGNFVLKAFSALGGFVADPLGYIGNIGRWIFDRVIPASVGKIIGGVFRSVRQVEGLIAKLF